MKNDFRALCAELAEKLDDLHCHYKVPSQSALIERARAALKSVAPLPLADAVATAESECLHFLTTETGRSLTPDLIESLYGQFRGIIAGLVDALAKVDEPAVPEGREPTRDDVLRWLQQDQAWGVLVAPTEWRPIDDEWLNLIHRAVLARFGRPVPAPIEINSFALDALEKLRYASISYRMNTYSEEELKIYEDRAARVLAATRPAISSATTGDQ